MRMAEQLQDLNLTTDLLSYIKTGGREGEREREVRRERGRGRGGEGKREGERERGGERGRGSDTPADSTMPQYNNSNSHNEVCHLCRQSTVDPIHILFLGMAPATHFYRVAWLLAEYIGLLACHK